MTSMLALRTPKSDTEIRDKKYQADGCAGECGSVRLCE